MNPMMIVIVLSALGATGKYMTPEEEEVVQFTNMARLDPKGFAIKYIGDFIKVHPGTPEAVTAKECIDEMTDAAMLPMAPLTPSLALILAAADHAKDQGKTGAKGHIGSDGSNPGKRINRYCQNSGYAENVAYGNLTSLEVVVILLIDHDVPGRGHRKNILDKDLNFIGVSKGPHASDHRFMVVQDFGIDVVENPDLPERDFTNNQTPQKGKGKLDIQEYRLFLGPSMGAGGQKLPASGSVSWPQFNINAVYINEAIIQRFTVGIGITKASKLITFGYGLGLGTRQGYYHGGLQFNLGYANIYGNTDGRIHGLHYKVGMFADLALPKWLSSSYRFYTSAGWAGLVVSNGDYQKNRQMGGWFFELGAEFSVY